MDLAARFADALVESLAGFFAQPLPLDHFLFEIERQEAVAPRIVGNGVIQICADECPHVQADDIEQAEAGAVGKADQRPGERVHFFDGEILFDRDLADGPAEESCRCGWR